MTGNAIFYFCNLLIFSVCVLLKFTKIKIVVIIHIKNQHGKQTNQTQTYSVSQGVQYAVPEAGLVRRPAGRLQLPGQETPSDCGQGDMSIAFGIESPLFLSVNLVGQQILKIVVKVRWIMDMDFD